MILAETFYNRAASLPLVSIIITNYNYGRFLLDALNSVVAQTYPNIECIIVDDASTDESKDVLEQIALQRPNVKIIRKQRNAGQTAACETGFQESSGQYVVFLDADDLLLPTFVETHIFVHLSLRDTVGFTSSDVCQTSGSQIVTAASSGLSRYVAAQPSAPKNILRRIDKLLPDFWGLENNFSDIIAGSITLLHLNDTLDFVYAPTSGNCFRRDALMLFLKQDPDGPGTQLNLACNADTYLNMGVCLVSGAALIDIPLTIYRIHGVNNFTAHPELSGVYANDQRKSFKASHNSWWVLVDRLIDDAHIFVPKLGVDRYKSALATLQNHCPISREFMEFENLSRYMEDKASAAAPMTALLGAENFGRLMTELRERRESARPERTEPRIWLKPLAELALTLGRALNSQKLTSLGARLWRL